MVQITDDEKFLWKDSIPSPEEAHRLAREVRIDGECLPQQTTTFGYGGKFRDLGVFVL